VAVGVTEILVPENPPVQFKVPDKQALAVSVTLLPAQIETLLGEIVGFVGTGFTTIEATSLESLVQPEIVQATL
jgi:hypothetical protein